MGYSPGAIKHAAQVNRSYAIYEGTVLHSGRAMDPDLDPFIDVQPLWNDTEGSSIANEIGTASYVDPEHTSQAAAARCQSTGRTTVDSHKVTATYLNSHEIQSTHPGVLCITQDYGRTRAERLYVSDASDTKISGTCRIDSDLLTGIGIPAPSEPDEIGMKVYAGASMGISEPTSFIKAEWMRFETPQVWRVHWQYVYYPGNQHQVRSGTYDLSGFAALQKLTDFINFEYNLGAADKLQIRAYQNLESWDDIWWASNEFAWGSLYKTIVVGESGGAVKGGMTREAISEVDEQYTARTFPADPRS